MTAKRPKQRRGSSKAGRPRKTGARHPGGKLIQTAEPNERVMSDRKAMIGNLKVDLSTAEDAMSLALAHGWLTEAQHRAGEAYSRAYRLSHPRRHETSSREAPDDDGRDLRKISQMGSAEIVQAFDNILNGTQMPGASERRQVDARRRYNSMSSAMTAPEQAEVFLCFCLRSWPQWIVWRINNHDHTPWERKYTLLVRGLDALSSHLRRGAKQGNAYRNDMVA